MNPAPNGRHSLLIKHYKRVAKTSFKLVSNIQSETLIHRIHRTTRLRNPTVKLKEDHKVKMFVTQEGRQDTYVTGLQLTLGPGPHDARLWFCLLIHRRQFENSRVGIPRSAHSRLSTDGPSTSPTLGSTAPYTNVRTLSVGYANVRILSTTLCLVAAHHDSHPSPHGQDSTPTRTLLTTLCPVSAADATPTTQGVPG